MNTTKNTPAATTAQTVPWAAERAALEQKLRELTTTIYHRRDEIGSKREPDPLDNVLQLSQVEFVAGSLDREVRQLAQVRAALDRLKNGSYGTCQHCEEPIAPKRLRAVPEAALCIRCQTAADAAETGANYEAA